MWKNGVAFWGRDGERPEGTGLSAGQGEHPLPGLGFHGFHQQKYGDSFRDSIFIIISGWWFGTFHIPGLSENGGDSTNDDFHWYNQIASYKYLPHRGAAISWQLHNRTYEEAAVLVHIEYQPMYIYIYCISYRRVSSTLFDILCM